MTTPSRRVNKSTPANDISNKTIEFNGVTLTVKTKFKIFKFMKMIDKDPIGAMSLALTEESLAVAEDLEMDFNDFEVLVNMISDALSGADLKN